MSISRHLRRWHKWFEGSPSRPAARRVPRLGGESLEDRTLPSAASCRAARSPSTQPTLPATAARLTSRQTHAAVTNGRCRRAHFRAR